MGIERLHMHGPIPSCAHDLRQPLGIVLIGLVHLHLERGTRVPCIKADDVEPPAAQFMHKPRCHRPGFNSNAGVISRAASHNPLNRLGI
jgi:hypothetical protein